MVAVKWPHAIKGPIVKVDGPLCGGLYKEDYRFIVIWSGKYPDSNLNCFTWSKEQNNWIVPGDQYNEEFKNWRGPIHNGQFRPQTIKKKIRTERVCSKFSGSIKFNGIPREVNLEIPIKSYKGLCRDHMIKNGIWHVFFLPELRNKEKKWDILLHQSIFPLEYMKHHIKILQKHSKENNTFFRT